MPDQCNGWECETLKAAKPVETDRSNKAVSVLLAHIVSTRCCGQVITDKDMEFPENWRELNQCTDVGHQEKGRTVAMHSLAVSPTVQGCGIGKMIVRAYLQQVKDADLGDTVALLCQDVSDVVVSFCTGQCPDH